MIGYGEQAPYGEWGRALIHCWSHTEMTRGWANFALMVTHVRADWRTGVLVTTTQSMADVASCRLHAARNYRQGVIRCGWWTVRAQGYRLPNGTNKPSTLALTVPFCPVCDRDPAEYTAECYSVPYAVPRIGVPNYQKNNYNYSARERSVEEPLEHDAREPTLGERYVASLLDPEQWRDTVDRASASIAALAALVQPPDEDPE